MAEKSPMIGVVVSPSLLQRLEIWQARERRKSFSEFCALLLEFAVTELEEKKTLNALLPVNMSVSYYLSKDGKLAYRTRNNEEIVVDPPSPATVRVVAELQAQKGRNVHGQLAKPQRKSKRPSLKAS